jgi:phytoene desaturase
LCKLNEVEMPTFIDRNYDSPLDLARSIRPLVTLARMGGFGTLDRQVAGDSTTSDCDGSSPSRPSTPDSPAAGARPVRLITYMDSVEGCVVPEGGIHGSRVHLLVRWRLRVVEVRCGVRVAGIELARPEGWRGARAANTLRRVHPADCVVCNADVRLPTHSCCHNSPCRGRVERAHPSPCRQCVWHAGVRGRPSADTAHHNIHFGAAWSPAFRALITDRQRMPDPSILVTVPTQTDPSLAPRDASTVYALEPVPNLRGSIGLVVGDDIGARRSACPAVEARLSDGCRGRDDARPLEWRRSRLCRWHTVLGRSPVLPVGPVPHLERGSSGAGTRVRRRQHGSGVGVPMVLLSGRLAALRAMEALQS